MKKICVIPEVPIVGVSFKGVKIHAIPNQSYTLKEILNRFVRRESLPVHQEGIYNDSGIDLEKVRHMDFVEQREVLEHVKSAVKRHERRTEELKPRPPAAPDSVPPSPPPA